MRVNLEGPKQEAETASETDIVVIGAMHYYEKSRRSRCFAVKLVVNGVESEARGTFSTRSFMEERSIILKALRKAGVHPGHLQFSDKMFSPSQKRLQIKIDGKPYAASCSGATKSEMFTKAFVGIIAQHLSSQAV